MNCLWSLNIPLLQSNPIIINFTSGGGEGGGGGRGRGGGGRRGLPYERVGNVRSKIRIKTLKGI